MSRLWNDDRGFSAIWVAVVALFLVGSAALAVDTSGAFATARTDQNTADLSCLAGVAELPDDAAAGIDVAVAYAVDNWPKMAGNSLTTSGTTGTYADGSGNEVYVDAAYEGNPSRMYVRITEVRDTYFGKVIGNSSITVVQDAACVLDLHGQIGIPFGAPVGGFTGGIFGPNPCGSNSGNCGSLQIPRDDVSGTGPTLINNIARGPDRNLDEWLGHPAGSSHCALISAGGTCQRLDTDTGVSAAHLGEGFLQRFENDPGATQTTTVNGRVINADTITDVLGTDPITPLDSSDPQPSWWEPSLYGDWNAANTQNHVYFNGVIQKCDSPRLARMPIISEDLNWDIGDPDTDWPNGVKEVKIVGFYWVYIERPNDASDFTGGGSLKKAGGTVIWFGPDTECQGSSGTYPFDPDNPIARTDVYLVAPGA